MKILVAVDGSDYTRRMLAYLAAHEQWFNASHRYTLLTVVPAVPPRAAAALGHDEMASYYAEEAERVFEPIRSFFSDRQVEVAYEHHVGHASEVIAQVATDGGYDLIAMGSHGHGTLGSLVMGSTTSKVIGSCSVPVLLIR